MCQICLKIVHKYVTKLKIVDNPFNCSTPVYPRLPPLPEHDLLPVHRHTFSEPLIANPPSMNLLDLLKISIPIPHAIPTIIPITIEGLNEEIVFYQISYAHGCAWCNVPAVPPVLSRHHRMPQNTVVSTTCPAADTLLSLRKLMFLWHRMHAHKRPRFCSIIASYTYQASQHPHPLA